MKFTNKVYDVLKAIAMLYLPAAATLFYTLAQIWHWHHVDDVMGSITGKLDQKEEIWFKVNPLPR